MVISKVATAVTADGLVFADLAFVAGYRAMLETRRQANIAQATLVAGERPWLKVESVNVTGMVVDDIAVTVWAQVTAKNVGHSPAQDVFLASDLLLSGLERDKAAVWDGYELLMPGY